MGVIVNDTTTLPSGLELSGYYASLGSGGEVFSSKNQMTQTPEFITRGNVIYWVNKDARLSNKHPVHTEYITVSSNTAPTSSAYQVLYDKFKEGLTDFVDDM